MEIIWVLLLTVCSNTGCIIQEVPEVKDEQECQLIEELIMTHYPSDGDWVSITWECKTKNGLEV